MEELGRLKKVVFVILFDDAELFGIVQGAKMDSGGVDGRGDIHEFESEGACGKREIADITNESNIGVVDGNVQIGLIVEAGGLVAGGGTRRVLFLRGIDFFAADRGKEYRCCSGENGNGGNFPKQSIGWPIQGHLHHLHLNLDLPSRLERYRLNFLQGTTGAEASYQGCATGFQVWPPSLVSKPFVLPAFQIVAWSASEARTPPRSSARGDETTFQ